jgi:hypothetical protein
LNDLYSDSRYTLVELAWLVEVEMKLDLVVLLTGVLEALAPRLAAVFAREPPELISRFREISGELIECAFASASRLRRVIRLLLLLRKQPNAS